MKNLFNHRINLGVQYLLLGLLLPVASFAQGADGPDESNALAGRQVIYYNLGLDNITMTPTKVIGYVWNGSAWVHTDNGGAYTNGYYYHIIVDPDRHFNGDPEAFNRVYQQPITEINGGSVQISKVSDAVSVLEAWNDKADELHTVGKRQVTNHHLTVSCEGGYYILLDNVWSTYQTSGSSRMTGGLAFYPQRNASKLRVYLKGDNRLGNIYYSSTMKHDSRYTSLGDYPFTPDSTPKGAQYGTTEFTDARLVFYSAEAGNKGTLTVGDIVPNPEGDDTLGANYYNSVIGGSDDDDKQDSRGIVIYSGTIFAGAVPKDVCSAIGGGGNGVGNVSIYGGVVTAVTSSTGTAIGGGIGWSQRGGAGNVFIQGGEVYAYNNGIVRFWRDDDPSIRPDNYYVPAAAIGGGSSFKEKCDDTTITIKGGEVTAQSVGGVAIGGGGSGFADGGKATIDISGSSTIRAKSIGGSQLGVTIHEGSSIGGGVGGVGGLSGTALDNNGPGNGGDCIFKMSGGSLFAGSVGGGSINPQNTTEGITLGKANVNITGGTIQAQFIMAQGSSDHCEFNMSAGKIDNTKLLSDNYYMVKKDGGALWMDDPAGIVNITGGEIKECSADNGGAIYTTGGVVTVSNATIQGCKALSGNGGAIVVEPHEGDDSVFPTVTLNSAIINGNQATNNGGAIAVLSTGATVTLTSATVNDNTAQNNGGAFYLGDNATVEITGGYTNNNTATSENGGAFFLSKKATATINSGTIDGNKALNGNGGAFFGNEESVITMNSGNIESNKARNGGGVYLAKSAKLVYTINDAVDGYIRDNHASQFGGGAYLAEGTTSKKTELDFIRIADATSLGFYDNTADVGADDIFAYGLGTTLFTIPKVTTMNLERYSLPGATLQWWEDYEDSDSRYSDGTLQGDPVHIHRYRASRDALDPIWRVPKVADYDLSNFYEKYLCLTLGFEYGDLEIRRSGLHERENAVFKIEFQGELSRPAQYVTILGEESKKIEYDGVKYNVARIGFLPLGTYKVTEVPWAWYNESSSTEATVKIQDITDEEEKIFIFQNTHKDLGTTPLHDEELKVNDLKP